MAIRNLLGKSVAELFQIYREKCITDDEVELEEGESRYVEVPEAGISIVLDNHGLAASLLLYSKDVDPEYEPFKEVFLEGFQFSDSRATVRSKLGYSVDFDNGGEERGLFGRYLNPWDAYFIGQYRYHFEYTEDAKSIRMVEITQNLE